MTHYCPNCWGEVEGHAVKCPHCGYDLQEYSRLPYEEKLLLALSHPVPENRLMAISILGQLRSERALPYLERLIETEQSFYILQEVLNALSMIGTPRSKALLRRACDHHTRLVRDLANHLLRQP